MGEERARTHDTPPPPPPVGPTPRPPPAMACKHMETKTHAISTIVGSRRSNTPPTTGIASPLQSMERSAKGQKNRGFAYSTQYHRLVNTRTATLGWHPPWLYSYVWHLTRLEPPM